MPLPPKSIRRRRFETILVLTFIALALAPLAVHAWLASKVGWKPAMQSFATTWLFALVASLFALLPAIAFAWHRHIRWKRDLRAAGHCPRCEYDRRGLPPTLPCPECATPFNPPIPTTTTPNK